MNSKVPRTASVFRAARKGDADKLKAAFEAGFDGRKRDGNGWTLLHAAAREGHSEAVSLLLEQGLDPNSMNPGVGFTPLIVACFGNGHTEVVRALLDAGAHPSLAGPPGVITPLDCCVQDHEDTQTGELLLAAGADPDLPKLFRRLSPEREAKWRAIIARFEHVPKRRSADALAAGIGKPTPEPETPPLDLAKVVRPEHPNVPVAAEVDQLEQEYGRLPRDWRAFWEELGWGVLDGAIRIDGPSKVRESTETFRSILHEGHWFWGSSMPRDPSMGAVVAADTLDGDVLAWLPALGQFGVFPRHGETATTHRSLASGLQRLLDILEHEEDKHILEINSNNA